MHLYRHVSITANALFNVLPVSSISRLQYIQNSAARLLTHTKRSAHITPILKDLHWLPVVHRIKFKVLLLTFKSLHGLAPPYLCNMLVPYTPTRSLRSSDSSLLVIPRYRLSSMGGRSCSTFAPKLWNSLPRSLCSVNNITEFKSLLKTHLFSECYLPECYVMSLNFCFVFLDLSLYATLYLSVPYHCHLVNFFYVKRP